MPLPCKAGVISGKSRAYQVNQRPQVNTISIRKCCFSS